MRHVGHLPQSLSFRDPRNFNGSVGWLKQACQQLEKGAFTGAAGADERDEFAVGNTHRHIGEHGGIPFSRESVAHVVNGYVIIHLVLFPLVIPNSTSNCGIFHYTC
ncbi:hypothetical protein D3C74_354550 [compost metagenome]